MNIIIDCINYIMNNIDLDNCLNQVKSCFNFILSWVPCSCTCSHKDYDIELIDKESNCNEHEDIEVVKNGDVVIDMTDLIEYSKNKEIEVIEDYIM
jgi:hypothetical protein